MNFHICGLLTLMLSASVGLNGVAATEVTESLARFIARADAYAVESSSSISSDEMGNALNVSRPDNTASTFRFDEVSLGSILLLSCVGGVCFLIRLCMRSRHGNPPPAPNKHESEPESVGTATTADSEGPEAVV